MGSGFVGTAAWHLAPLRGHQGSTWPWVPFSGNANPHPDLSGVSVIIYQQQISAPISVPRHQCPCISSSVDNGFFSNNFWNNGFYSE